LLDTHYATDAVKMPAGVLPWRGGTIRTRRYREGGWSDAFSGVGPESHWLYRDDLLTLVRDVGFECIEILRDVEERNGPRIGLLARRS
jgi:hypothetical protein